MNIELVVYVVLEDCIKTGETRVLGVFFNESDAEAMSNETSPINRWYVEESVV